MNEVFSIIVPVYNCEKYLTKCLDSILAQTFSNFEAILVDDGATDASPNICDEYAARDKRIKVIHKSNGGVTSARKTGVRNICGRYAVCVDADDYIAPEYLAKFYNAIAEKEVDIICCGYVNFDDQNNSQTHMLGCRSGYYDRADIEKNIIGCLLESAYAHAFKSTVWAAAIKRELFSEIQLYIDDSIKIGEDAACIKSCLYNAQSLYIAEDCLYFYRNNEQSTISVRKPRNWQEAELIAQTYEKFVNLADSDLQEQLYRNVCHIFFNICISHIRGTTNYKQTKQDIKQHLHSDKISLCCRNACYKSRNGKVMLWMLKHKAIWLMKLYSKNWKRK